MGVKKPGAVAGRAKLTLRNALKGALQNQRFWQIYV